MAKTIIDVSEHQGKIDWAAIKKRIDGAIIRCGYGDDDKGQDDKWWAYNVEQCEKLGIPYGVYLYSYANSDAHIESEIAHAKRLLKGRKLSYPVYIDLEEEFYGPWARKTADRFCAAMEKAGYMAGVYAGQNYFNDWLRLYSKYTLWIARYNINDGSMGTKPSVGVKYDAWQYTSNGRIAGYPGRLDVSVFYRDFPAELAGSKQAVKPTETAKPVKAKPAAKPVAKTADDVLKIVRAELGKTDGTKYGNWYESNVDKNAYNYDFGAAGVPWCAMGASWAFDKAGVKCAGLPGAYCPTMLAIAKTKGKTVPTKECKPGYVVYFDWDGGESDHVGICVKNYPDKYVMDTIEFNTDYGVVAEKRRYYSQIVGCVKPDYGSTPSGGSDAKPAPKTAPTVAYRASADKAGKIWGPEKKNGATAGTAGKDMRWLAIDITGWYQVETEANGWLPPVYGYDIGDLENGCAGDGSRIIAVRCFFETQDTAGGLFEAKYRVSDTNKGFWPYQTDDDTGNGMDGYAGNHAPVDRFELAIVRVGGAAPTGTGTTTKAKPAATTVKPKPDNSDLAHAACSLAYSRPSQHNPKTGANARTKIYGKVYDALFKAVDTKKAAPHCFNVQGRSCDRSIATAIRWSGADDAMKRAIAYIYSHMKASSRWKDLGTWDGKESSLKPGDVLIRLKTWPGVTSNHVCMYVGESIAQEVYKKALKGTDADKGAPASDATWVSGHYAGGNPPDKGYAPCIGNAKYAGANKKMHVFRCVKPQGSSKYKNLGK